MGRDYLPELLQFILTFKKKYISTSDQNYHILKGVSVKTKLVKQVGCDVGLAINL